MGSFHYPPWNWQCAPPQKPQKMKLSFWSLTNVPGCLFSGGDPVCCTEGRYHCSAFLWNSGKNKHHCFFCWISTWPSSEMVSHNPLMFFLCMFVSNKIVYIFYMPKHPTTCSGIGAPGRQINPCFFPHLGYANFPRRLRKPLVGGFNPLRKIVVKLDHLQ